MGWLKLNIAKTIFIFLVLILLGSCRSSIETDLDENVDDYGLANVESLNDYIKVTRFLPDDPTKMTDDDVAWFSNNSWNMQWDFRPDADMPSYTEEQENIMKIEMEGTLKTLNYLLYTKPFAVYLQKMFERHTYTAVDNNPENAPSPLGLLLALRGMDSKNFHDEALHFRLKDGGSHQGNLSLPYLNKEKSESYTLEDLKSGKWNYLKGVTGAFKQVQIPFSYEEPYYYLEYLRDGISPPYASTLRTMFEIVIIFHEMLHIFFGFDHKEREGSLDLVYHLSVAAGTFTSAWGWDLDENVFEELKVGHYATTRTPIIEQLFGGHLPFGISHGRSPAYVFYTIQIQHTSSKLGKKLYPIDLPDTGIGVWDTEQPTAVPKDPFEKINWNMRYVGSIAN